MTCELVRFLNLLFDKYESLLAHDLSCKLTHDEASEFLSWPIPERP